MVRERRKAVDTDRVRRSAERLRYLEPSGVELFELLSGEAGIAFVRDDCQGDPEIAISAFALVHSPARRENRLTGQ